MCLEGSNNFFGYFWCRHFRLQVIGCYIGEGISTRSSPSKQASTPPFEEEGVTWAYFSVSAIRSCFFPDMAEYFAENIRKIVGRKRVSSHWLCCVEYSTIPKAGLNVGIVLSNLSKEGFSMASNISRALSPENLPLIGHHSYQHLDSRR